MKFKLIDRYIFSQVFFACFACIFIFMIVWIMPEILLKTVQRTINGTYTIEMALSILLCELPKVLNIALPVGMLLGTILTFDKQLNLISLENIVQVSEEVGISQFVENFTGAVDEPAWFNIEDFAGMPVQPDPSTGGTITLDQGIEITYRGFLNKWIINWGEGAQLCLFDISCGMPNQQFAAPAARIEKTTEDGVVDYYVRVKVNYIYELNVDESRAEITTENYTAAELGITDADIIVKCWEFADEWTVAADGYAYYTCSGSILKALTTTQTNIFNTAEGASKLTLADWTSEFGGPRIIFEGTEREIVKIAGWLTIEAVSVGDAKLENWAIKAA